MGDEERGRNRGGPAARLTHRGRSAYLTWLSTPPADRPPEIATREKFCREFQCSIQDLYGWMAEIGFMESVVTNIDHWREKTGDIIAAIKRNAEDPQRPDQLRWCVAYLEIVKHPAVEALTDLLEEDDARRTTRAR